MPTDKRMFVLAAALYAGYDVDTLYRLTAIDKWFLHKFRNIISTTVELENTAVNVESESTASPIPRELLLKAKQIGFSDRQIAKSIKWFVR